MTSRGHRRPHVVPITAPSFPTLPRPRVYKTIAYTFIGIVVVVIVAVLWLSSARASIAIKAKQESVKLDALVQVAKSPEQGQLAGRVVSGVFRNIQEFQTAALVSSTDAGVMTSSSLPVAVSSSTVPTNNSSAVMIAKGAVRVINKYSRSQTLVKTTRLLTSDKKLYRIDKDIVIAPGKEVSVGVYADQPGAEFAITPSTFTIPGLFIDMQKYIYAVSDQAFVAVASDKPIVPAKPVVKTTKVITPAKPTGPIVTASLIEEAQRQLTATTLEKAKKALASDIGDPRFGEVQYTVKSVEQKANVSPGQAADTFLASVALEVTAVYYPKDDMLILMRQKLKEKIPEGKELLPFGPEAVTYAIETSDVKNETASIHVLVDGAYRLTALSPALQKNLFAGKSKAEVINTIRAIQGVEDVTITTQPNWYGKIPSLQDHIEVRVE